MRGAPVTKVFYGKQFRLVKELRTEEEAKKVADETRNLGRSVHVARKEGSGNWLVYARSRPNKGTHRQGPRRF